MFYPPLKRTKKSGIAKKAEKSSMYSLCFQLIVLYLHTSSVFFEKTDFFIPMLSAY